ncbi:MAG TPA: hypothetical protein DCY13_00470 [Verrucomicrobiales bacterium]|nr:hypothetical protein [Verrucomicrobiales bacterium]
MEHSLINDIAVCIVVAFGLAVVSQWLRQPLIVAYLGAGFVAGPVALGWVQDQHSIETIGELGLLFLLFMIGLEIDLKKVLSSGRVILVTALVQIVGCLLLGLAAFKFAGFPLSEGRLDALYLALAVTFSSTVIIVKILYDKRELDTFPGRVTLGVLVLQDVAAILFLALQNDLNNPSAGRITMSLVKVLVLVAVAFAVSRYVLPALFRSVARLPELVLVGALAWCFLVAGLASALELSREMGALIAGVALSTFPYTLDVAARVNTLRDFFVTLFFVALGMQIPIPNAEMLRHAVLLAAVVALSRVLTVFPPLHFMRMGIRGSLLPTINLSQVSEFALVMVALGVTYGHIGPQTTGVILYAFVFMAVVSSYAIGKSDFLLKRSKPLLRKVGVADLDETALQAADGDPSHAAASIYLLGFSWSASSLLEEITRHSPHLLPKLAVVDFNPVVAHELRRRGVRIIYGDITQRDTLIHAGIPHADVIVCTLPNTVLKGSNNLRMARELHAINPNARIIMHAEKLNDVQPLYEAGADYVSVTRLIEAERLHDVVCAACEQRMAEARRVLDETLRDRHEVIP